MLRVHWFQHVPFENLGKIEDWAKRHGHHVAGTRLFENQPPPEAEDYDWLFVMGGPMSVSDFRSHPWLVAEKRAIGGAIDSGKVVVGVCLGAQLIASVLGADVTRSVQKEIGWHPVSLTAEGSGHALTDSIPETFNAFHWHSDTFGLPEGAVHLASSDACRNQMFLSGDRVLGLQFHLEMTESGISKLIENCGDELVTDEFVQSANAIREGKSHLQGGFSVLDSLLDHMLSTTQSQSR